MNCLRISDIGIENASFHNDFRLTCIIILQITLLGKYNKANDFDITGRVTGGRYSANEIKDHRIRRHSLRIGEDSIDLSVCCVGVNTCNYGYGYLRRVQPLTAWRLTGLLADGGASLFLVALQPPTFVTLVNTRQEALKHGPQPPNSTRNHGASEPSCRSEILRSILSLANAQVRKQNEVATFWQGAPRQTSKLTCERQKAWLQLRSPTAE